MQENGTSSNIHGKQWAGTQVHDQTWVLYTAQDNTTSKNLSAMNFKWGC